MAEVLDSWKLVVIGLSFWPMAAIHGSHLVDWHVRQAAIGLARLKPRKGTSSLRLPRTAQTIPQKTARAEKLLIADGVNVMFLLHVFVRAPLSGVDSGLLSFL
jgi:hypothetical protein